jgi:hypothetical protein
MNADSFFILFVQTFDQAADLGTTIASLGKAIGAETKPGSQILLYLVLIMAFTLQVAAVTVEGVAVVVGAKKDPSFSSSPLNLQSCF